MDRLERCPHTGTRRRTIARHSPDGNSIILGPFLRARSATQMSGAGEALPGLLDDMNNWVPSQETAGRKSPAAEFNSGIV